MRPGFTVLGGSVDVEIAPRWVFKTLGYNSRPARSYVRRKAKSLAAVSVADAPIRRSLEHSRTYAGRNLHRGGYT